MFQKHEIVVTGSIPAVSSPRSRPATGRRALLFAGGALAWTLPLGALPLQVQSTGAVENGGGVENLGSPILVKRDVHGVPHIEASDEAGAWYALGYEEARDGLWEIQKVVKAVKGEASKYLGDSGGASFLGLPGNIFADLANKLFDAHLGGMLEDDLKELFKDEDAPHPSEEYQLYYNLKAYAEGIEDFRAMLKAGHVAGTLLGEKAAMAEWLADPLANPDRSWALNDPITYRDIMSWGRHTKAAAQLGMAALAEMNPHPMEVLPGAPMPVSSGSRYVPAEPINPMEHLKQLFKGIIPMGSNGIAWSFDYQEEGGVAYAGLLADQQGAPQDAFVYPNGPNDLLSGNVWYDTSRSTKRIRTNATSTPSGTCTTPRACSLPATTKTSPSGGAPSATTPPTGSC